MIDPSRKLMATPTPNFTPFYAMPEDNPTLRQDMPMAPEGLPDMKPEDMQYFSKLLQVPLPLGDNGNDTCVGWLAVAGRSCLFS